MGQSSRFTCRVRSAIDGPKSHRNVFKGGLRTVRELKLHADGIQHWFPVCVGPPAGHIWDANKRARIVSISSDILPLERRIESAGQNLSRDWIRSMVKSPQPKINANHAV